MRARSQSTANLVSQEILDAALAVPESETYQFVVHAVIDHGDTKARKTAPRPSAGRTRRGIASVHERAAGPVGVAFSEQLRVAREYLEQSEIDREATRARLAEVSRELDGARRSLLALREEDDVLRRHVGQLDAHLEEVRRDLDAARRDLDAARRDLDAARREVDVARRELVAACIAEARARTELHEQRSSLDEFIARAEQATADQQLLAEITGSRAYHAITRYRRGANRLVPPGSGRRAALRPFARFVQLR